MPNSMPKPIKLAHYLNGFGIGPQSLVGCCMERSSELIVTLLGILKAGGAYVAIDPNTAPKRLQWIPRMQAPKLL